MTEVKKDAQQVEQNNVQKALNRVAVVGIATSLSVPAFAADYNVTEIISNLGNAVTAAATIGVAWLGFTAGIAIWRNLRAAAK